MKGLLDFDYSQMRGVLLEALIIVCLGIGFGLNINYPLLAEVFTGDATPSQPPVITEADQPPLITRAEVDALGDKALRVDARIRELYAAGHLPQAVSLPIDEIDTALPEFSTEIAATTPLIVYCSGYGCPDSFDLAKKLLAAGYRDVRVYEGGFPEWQDSGLPIIKEQP